MSKKRIAQTGSGLVLTMDLLISMASSGAAVLAIRWLVHPISGFTIYMLIWMLVAFCCSLIGFVVAGTNKIVIRYSSFRSISRLFGAVVIKEMLFGFCLWAQFFHFVNKRTELMVLGADFLITLIALILARVLFITLHNRLVENMETEVKRTPVLIYGLSGKSLALMDRLEKSTFYKVEGFVTRNQNMDGRIINECKVFAFEDDEDIQELKTTFGICAVLFADEEDAAQEQDGLVGICIRCGLHIISTPKQEEQDFGGMSSEALHQVTQSDYIPDGMSAVGRFLKRSADLVLSGILIIIFAIPMLACYIALKLGDGGPAIYKQERIGRFGRPFYILKFRSMRLDAEKFGPALYAGDDDPRLTKVGRFLRVHHLDEMPQLFNVFKGDMAFVGYRPERRFYIDQIIEKDPRYYYLYQIRPGVTSYATLKNGYTDTIEKMIRRLEFDLYYLRHRSVAFDMEILWRTFTSIVFGKKF